MNNLINTKEKKLLFTFLVVHYCAVILNFIGMSSKASALVFLSWGLWTVLIIIFTKIISILTKSYSLKEHMFFILIYLTLPIVITIYIFLKIFSDKNEKETIKTTLQGSVVALFIFIGGTFSFYNPPMSSFIKYNNITIDSKIKFLNAVSLQFSPALRYVSQLGIEVYTSHKIKYLENERLTKKQFCQNLNKKDYWTNFEESVVQSQTISTKSLTIIMSGVMTKHIDDCAPSDVFSGDTITVENAIRMTHYNLILLEEYLLKQNDILVFYPYITPFNFVESYLIQLITEASSFDIYSKLVLTLEKMLEKVTLRLSLDEQEKYEKNLEILKKRINAVRIQLEKTPGKTLNKFFK